MTSRRLLVAAATFLTATLVPLSGVSTPLGVPLAGGRLLPLTARARGGSSKAVRGAALTLGVLAIGVLLGACSGSPPSPSATPGGTASADSPLGRRGLPPATLEPPRALTGIARYQRGRDLEGTSPLLLGPAAEMDGFWEVTGPEERAAPLWPRTDSGWITFVLSSRDPINGRTGTDVGSVERAQSNGAARDRRRPVRGVLRTARHTDDLADQLAAVRQRGPLPGRSRHRVERAHGRGVQPGGGIRTRSRGRNGDVPAPSLAAQHLQPLRPLPGSCSVDAQRQLAGQLGNPVGRR